MSINVDARPRRRARGLLAQLFFGKRAPATPKLSAPPVVMEPPPEEPPAEAKPEEIVPSRPSYTRPLPTGPELANDIGYLRTFSLPQPNVDTDQCLMELLRQLCYQFLGGPPRERTQVPSRFGADIDQQYQGASMLRMDLQDALKRILTDGVDPKGSASTNTTTTNNNMTNDINAGKDERVRPALELFYRHIMILIKALMIHLYMYRLLPDETNVGAMHTWYAVLGHLESLRITLVHASEIGQIDLHEAPRYWEELIDSTVNQIQKCLRALHSAEDKALTLKSNLSARDKESDDLRKRYDPSALRLELVQGERACALDALRNVTSVASILHNESTHPI